jgi:hypothetical protein
MSEIQAIRETLRAMRAEMVAHEECKPGDDLDILVGSIAMNLDLRVGDPIGEQIQGMIKAAYVLGKLNAHCSRKSLAPRRGSSEYVREIRGLYGEWASIARELCERIVNGSNYSSRP